MNRQVSSLTQRVVTAAVLLPLFVGGILLLPSSWFALVLAVFVLLGGWEWAAFAGWAHGPSRAVYALSFAFALAGCWLLQGRPAWLLGMLIAALLWWLVALVLVVGHKTPDDQGGFSRPLVTVSGWLVLLPAWTALVVLHSQREVGPWLVVFLFTVVWVADSGAFFAGRRWGRHRLAPRVSPGKTWEGAMGGLLAALLMAAAAYPWVSLRHAHWVLFLALTVVTVAGSILGDLLESLYKRQAGLKDSGTLLPGHGGILDRIDSISCAAPLFLAGLMALGEL